MSDLLASKSQLDRTNIFTDIWQPRKSNPQMLDKLLTFKINFNIDDLILIFISQVLDRSASKPQSTSKNSRQEGLKVLSVDASMHHASIMLKALHYIILPLLRSLIVSDLWWRSDLCLLLRRCFLIVLKILAIYAHLYIGNTKP